MSKNTKELIRRRRPVNEDPAQVVNRESQSKLPLIIHYHCFIYCFATI